jgi:hypothetical protein
MRGCKPAPNPHNRLHKAYVSKTVFVGVQMGSAIRKKAIVPIFQYTGDEVSIQHQNCPWEGRE